MAKKNELPFNHKLFYLDLTTNLALKQKIETCVKKLGGTVETFLDRKVRYVVTDKPIKDWPVIKKSNSNDLTTKINSDKKDDNRIDLMNNLTSRGKMLANKTPNSSINKTKDVLETALRLNMKILTHRSILDFCKKHIKEPIDEQQTNDQQSLQQLQLNQQQIIQQHLNQKQNNLHNSQKQQFDNQSLQQQTSFLSNSSVKIKTKQLKSPFLKFEDKDEKFAPCYKEFDIWPSVCMNNSKNNSSNLQQTPNQQQIPKNINTSKLMQPVQKKKARVFFCEICSKEFTNMIEHVKTDQHQNYMNNDDNYKELKSVIDSLPNWITLNESNAFDENDEFTDEESDFEDEESDYDDEEGYSSESKDTALSDNELNKQQQQNISNNQQLEQQQLEQQKMNSDLIVPASFTTPIKIYELKNIFNNIKPDEC